MADDLSHDVSSSLHKTHRALPRPDFRRIALVLQGGGALGSYQAGAYEALHEAGLKLDWIGGVSIGAINAALIAGAEPRDRLAKLRAFWTQVSLEPALLSALAGTVQAFGETDQTRAWLNHLSAGSALCLGVNAFFTPRWPPPWAQAEGAAGATSWYDTAPLRRALDRLVDFDRLNGGEFRFGVGAVNVRSGNLVFFDSHSEVIALDHILASAALPPMFPPVEIGGQPYWDGGLVSNTPLNWVIDTPPHEDALVFQVDLWSTRGEPPRDLAEVTTRTREIQFASRSRAATDTFRRLQRLKNGIHEMMAALPEDHRRLPQIQALAGEAKPMALKIVHLIYHAKLRQGTTKEFEFSRLNIREHWQAGYDDAVRTLRHREALRRPPPEEEEVGAFDVAVHGLL